MPLKDRLLSLDMGPTDCFYRLRRDFKSYSTVAYVYLRDLDILAADRQNYGPDVIKDLKAVVQVWDHDWKTITVFKEGDGVNWEVDQWEPHALPLSSSSSALPRINVLELVHQHKLKNRVSIIEHNEQRHILKICPFAHQVKYLNQELAAYHSLAQRECHLIPQLLGYVFERSEEEIIGFICEELKGRAAGISDYQECKKSLQQLHSYGIVHGDTNKFNIIMTDGGPRFIDLENAVLATDEKLSEEEFLRLQQAELSGLEESLKDEEGWGIPRTEESVE